MYEIGMQHLRESSNNILLCILHILREKYLCSNSSLRKYWVDAMYDGSLYYSEIVGETEYEKGYVDWMGFSVWWTIAIILYTPKTIDDS